MLEREGKEQRDTENDVSRIFDQNERGAQQAMTKTHNFSNAERKEGSQHIKYSTLNRLHFSSTPTQ